MGRRIVTHAEFDPDAQVREARIARMLTQAQLAKLAGISRRTLVYAEQGWVPSIETRRKLLTALDIPIHLQTMVWPSLPGLETFSSETS